MHALGTGDQAFLGENLLSSGNPLPMNRDSNKTGSIKGFFNWIFDGICFMFFFYWDLFMGCNGIELEFSWEF